MKGFLGKIFAFLIKPPVWAIVLTIACALVSVVGALACVFTEQTGVFAYTTYALAACFLAYTVYLFVKFAPTMKGGILAWLQRWRFTRAIVGDYGFRTLVFATCSLVVNGGFVAFNTLLAITTGNVWYGGLAGYYFLLGGLRSLVFAWNRRSKNKAKDEVHLEKLRWRNYGFCGGALLALNMALAVIVTLMVLERKPTKYTDVMAIAFAAYAFYKIILAIYNTLKTKKMQDLQLQAFRNIGLVDAAVSILSLQTALVATFSAEGASMLALNAAVGAVVCLLNITIGVYMIVQAVRRGK